uniref:CSON015495 protein n=1 Tax=Culicoides sonorensis TaxID=179676 RepID=A0A336LU14_CULSO
MKFHQNIIFLFLTIVLTSHISSTQGSSIRKGLGTESTTFQHPPIEIKVLQPKGFTVSIPAEAGISIFAFHGKLNKEFDGLEAGTWSQDRIKSKNGKFTYTNKITKLKIGDVLHFWTFTIHDGLGYRHDNGRFVVNSYDNTNRIRVSKPDDGKGDLVNGDFKGRKKDTKLKFR